MPFDVPSPVSATFHTQVAGTYVLKATVTDVANVSTQSNTFTVTVTGGPHGMHSVSQYWVEKHHDLMGGENSGAALQCRTCHGGNYRGTVLSRAGTDNTFSGRGTHRYWPGFQSGCYECHNKIKFPWN